MEAVFYVNITMLDGSSDNAEMTEKQLDAFILSLNTNLFTLFDFITGEGNMMYEEGIYIKSDQVKSVKFEYGYDQ